VPPAVVAKTVTITSAISEFLLLISSAIHQ
jgi:hypothetical protein